jgi:hypothetical protein
MIKPTIHMNGDSAKSFAAIYEKTGRYDLVLYIS